MPDLNSFGLESQINAWREGMIKQEALAAESIEELEQHLRDSFGRLKTKGLNDEEAFFVASHRLGNPAKLAIEHSKVNGALALTRRLYWMLSGYLFIELLTRSIGASSWIAQASVFAAIGGEYKIATVVFSAVVWIICLIGGLLYLYRSTKSSSTVTQWLGQLSNLGLGSIVVCLLLLLVVLRVLGPIALMQLSSPLEVGEIALVLAYTGQTINLLLPFVLLGVLLSVRKRINAEQAAMA